MVSVNRLCLKGPSGECWSDYYFGLREDIGCVFGVSDGGGQKRQIKNQEGGERQKEIYGQFLTKVKTRSNHNRREV